MFGRYWGTWKTLEFIRISNANFRNAQISYILLYLQVKGLAASDLFYKKNHSDSKIARKLGFSALFINRYKSGEQHHALVSGFGLYRRVCEWSRWPCHIDDVRTCIDHASVIDAAQGTPPKDFLVPVQTITQIGCAVILHQKSFWSNCAS